MTRSWDDPADTVTLLDVIIATYESQSLLRRIAHRRIIRRLRQRRAQLAGRLGQGGQVVVLRRLAPQWTRGAT
jgi:hypothetical protein